MRNIFRVDHGCVDLITVQEALETQKREDYGSTVVNCYCDTEEKANELADLYNAGEIGIDNISGQEAVQYKLTGLEE